MEKHICYDNVKNDLHLPDNWSCIEQMMIISDLTMERIISTCHKQLELYGQMGRGGFLLEQWEDLLGLHGTMVVISGRTM